MTRDVQRIEPMIQALRAAWYLHPDMRLGQIVNNAPYFDADGKNTSYAAPAFFVEDDQMYDGLLGLAKNARGL
ncbi:hypothetical protein [Rathayibacter sp. AY2B9]|uniref:hypothetical protein n=1 Tax=Rathayibacter sp. AY2B9 TaxID=2080572 RepID=UPI000CE8F9DC|nr:hypothetical protein [Rathayibacter sp. AY2B9]PPG34513.1 hypothetical protein C5C25_00385 [Rathayibacter sp. AY2B9]